MLTQWNMNADSPPLKRSFGEAVGHEFKRDPFPYPNHTEQNDYNISPIRPDGLDRSQSAFSPTKRRSISILRTSSMPLPTNSVATTIFPSFMSVFGSGGSQQHARQNKPLHIEQTKTGHDIISTTTPEDMHPTHHALPTSREHHRHNSVSSLTSDSSNSSPTTTVSTFDSPLVTDPSPSSSPETPSSTLPLSPFRSMMRPLDEHQKGRKSRENSLSELGSIDRTQSASPAAEKPRNVKNLSLKTTATALGRPATSSGVESMKSSSEESSPLPEPLRTGRRKPPGLTIQTPGFDAQGLTRTNTDVPATPSIRPTIQHFQSSPQFQLIGSAGGLRLPLPTFPSGHSRPGSQSSSAQSIGSSLHDVKEEDDLGAPRSNEAQPRGYPNGPIQIYDSGLYLYLEPTVEEAGRFDTVINVAKEVKNPFDNSSLPKNSTVQSLWRVESDHARFPEPQTAISEISFKSAFEWPQGSGLTTPTTPKASSSSQKPPPEYLHVPWDHNSEIVEDLYPLCKLIDSRIESGKKVLIHCQLGVSRSASLIIAYGLYKCYKPDFHSMYTAVKERSQWVGPNMPLIMQLSDFHSRLNNIESVSKSLPQEWFKSAGHAGDDIVTPTAAATSAVRQIKLNSPKPTTPVIAAEPQIRSRISKPDLNKKLPPIPPFYAVPTSTDSQPSTVKEVLPNLPLSPYVQSSASSPPPRRLPLRDFAPTIQIPPHRTQQANRSSLVTRSTPSAQMDLAMQYEPQTPSLFSPRATEFMANPFGRTVAGEIMMGSVPSTAVPIVVGSVRTDTESPKIDPRSPHQAHETGEIIRNIDDYL